MSNVIYDKAGIKLIHGDSLQVLDEITDTVDIVCTSPPYNSGKLSTSESARSHHEARYDIYMEDKTAVEYCEWTSELFAKLDKVLKPNGVVLYNMSYGTNSTSANDAQIGLMWLTVAEIITKTNFQVADCIIWKKKAALPNNSSSNKLTRICEFVFVLCRKSELKTFEANKEVVSVTRGQNYYSNIPNYVVARNNDEGNELNKATYSTDLCVQLLRIYAKTGATVLDPFSGTGTTGNACKQLNMKYIGIELSEAQCEYAKNRLRPKGLLAMV